MGYIPVGRALGGGMIDAQWEGKLDVVTNGSGCDASPAREDEWVGNHRPYSRWQLLAVSVGRTLECFTVKD